MTAPAENPAPAAPAAEGTPATPAPAPAPAAPEAPAAPPWGDDFDASKAWDTIKAQRDSEKALKEQLAAYKRAEQEKEDAEKSEAQKALERAEKAEAALATAQHEALVSKVAREHNVPAEMVDFLTAKDEDGLKAQAERLASLTPKPAPDVPGRPKPALTPGDTANPPPPAVDYKAIAEAVRKRT